MLKRLTAVEDDDTIPLPSSSSSSISAEEGEDGELADREGTGELGGDPDRLSHSHHRMHHDELPASSLMVRQTLLNARGPGGLMDSVRHSEMVLMLEQASLHDVEEERQGRTLMSPVDKKSSKKPKKNKSKESKSGFRLLGMKKRGRSRGGQPDAPACEASHPLVAADFPEVKRKVKAESGNVDKQKKKKEAEGHQPKLGDGEPTRGHRVSSLFASFRTRKHGDRAGKTDRLACGGNVTFDGVADGLSDPDVANPVSFGVPLYLAFRHHPSHDGVPLPAFFRQCIDYIEEHGLSTEGIYRVPGVNSQFYSLVNNLNRGLRFQDIPPTSALLYKSTSSRKTVLKPTAKKGCPASSTIANPAVAAGRLPHHQLPHDLYVVASAVKHFLRCLPDSVLTQRLGAKFESRFPFADEHHDEAGSTASYEELARLVHCQLPVASRYLLAWMLQHMAHIIDRAGDNLMILANLSIVFSPCLGISHRLLAVLLKPPSGFKVDLTSLDPDLPDWRSSDLLTVPSASQTTITSADLHWLFPHPAYRLRRYQPPPQSNPDAVVSVNAWQLNRELRQQELLRAHLQGQIARGHDTSRDSLMLLQEIEQLVDDLKRHRLEPDAIRESQLAQLYTELSASSTVSSRTSSSTVGILKPSALSRVGTGVDPCVATGHRRSQSGTLNPSCLLGQTPSPPPVQRHNIAAALKRHQQENLGTKSAAKPTVPECPVAVSPLANLVIPSVSELDQEEVLNLSLRKLSTTLSTPVAQPSAQPAAQPVPLETDRGDTTTTNTTAVPVRPQSIDCSSEAVRDPSVAPTTTGAQPINTDQADEAEPEVSDDRPVVCQTAGVDLASEPEPEKEPPEDVSGRLPSPPKIAESLPRSPDTDYHPFSPRSRVVSPLDDGDSEGGPVATETVSPQLMAVEEGSPGHQTETSRVLQQQVALQTARKLELMAIHSDLRARIQSENAEIDRLQSCIDDLVTSGGESLQRVYRSQLCGRYRLPTIRRVGTGDSCDAGGHSPLTWNQLADRMTSDEPELLPPTTWAAGRVTPVSSSSNSSRNSSCSSSGSFPEQEASVALLDSEACSSSSESESSSSPCCSCLAVQSKTATTSSRSSSKAPSEEENCHHPGVAYYRLCDDREGDAWAVAEAERIEEEEDKTMTLTQPHRDGSARSSTSGESSEAVSPAARGYATTTDDHASYSRLSGEVSPGDADPDMLQDLINEDEEDSDEDEEGSEVTLARTLLQLILDNARLERLNRRYLEGIQAERNRCAELKVLLKLRSNSFGDHPVEPM